MKKLICISAAILLMASGCTKENSNEEPNIAALSIYPSLRGVMTKAVIDNSNITGEKIRIQVAKEEDGSLSYLGGGAKYSLTYDAGNTKWVMSDKLYLTQDFARIYAYAPCPGDPETVETGSYSGLERSLDVPAAQNMAAQIDYLYCNQGATAQGGPIKINSANSAVNLTLDHALTQVAFVFYKENFSGPGVLSSVKIKDNSASPAFRVNKSGENDLKMSVADGSITGGEAAAEVSATGVGKTITLDTSPGDVAETLKSIIDAYIFLVPTVAIANKTDVEFIFNIDTKDYAVTLSGAGGINWVKGMQYIYTVKMRGSELTIEGVSVNPWTSQYEGEVIIN